jgi:CDGSH-type Zn-finger protein
LFEGTRVALCRCGASQHKPFCDNTHRYTDFAAEGLWIEHEPAPLVPGQVAPALTIRIEAGGPYRLQGDVDLYGEDDQMVARTNEAWLCRCGGSAGKPFCDGTHNLIGLTDEPGTPPVETGT